MSVDKPLRDIKHNSVSKGAVRLYPPRVFVTPHPETLRMPRFVFALSVPARHINVVHAAIMKWRAFRIVALKRHVSGRHVADTDQGQIANLACGNEPLDLLVIPGIAIEEIYGHETVAGLNLADQIPLCVHVGCKG